MCSCRGTVSGLVSRYHCISVPEVILHASLSRGSLTLTHAHFTLYTVHCIQCVKCQTATLRVHTESCKNALSTVSLRAFFSEIYKSAYYSFCNSLCSHYPPKLQISSTSFTFAYFVRCTAMSQIMCLKQQVLN